MATGQTTKYSAGDDGDLKKGAALSYADNGDGTITDTNTGFVWEAKTSCDGTKSATNLHDGDNTYPWAGTCSAGQLCGTDADCSGGVCKASDGQGTDMTVFKWVAALNAEKFAGHDDWRIPNIKELHSIVDYGKVDPSAPSAFNKSATSCTVSSNYWSSTGFPDVPPNVAWGIFFKIGMVSGGYKTGAGHVRAVRGGS